MIALINCSSGLAGNMFLGALMDAGVPIDYLISQLKSLNLTGWDLRTSAKKTGGITARLAEVITEETHHHRHLKDILAIIRQSELPDPVKDLSQKAFSLLAEAEAAAHGCSLDHVHFHEVGAMDCILDITGTFLGFHYLGVDRVFATPINLGGGTAYCQHGRLPVPVPAVAYLLKGLPVFSNTDKAELTTPTGAAILAALTPDFSPVSPGIIRTFGYGSGTHELDQANYLTLTFLEEAPATAQTAILEVETNLDDINPELYDFVIDQLFAAGAVDVFLTPIIMKKSRPAIKLTVLCKADTLTDVCRQIFLQTGSFGLRLSSRERVVLDSRFVQQDTCWGLVTYRTGEYEGQVISVKPEFEDCKRIAAAFNLPINQVYKQLLHKGASLYDHHS